MNRLWSPLQRVALLATAIFFGISMIAIAGRSVNAGTRSWDGLHSTENIEVTVVYFVPADREPLPDWQERVSYYCRRIELFHRREFGSQSSMKTSIHPEPFISQLDTSRLRAGDANAIFFRTLRETDRRLHFGDDKDEQVFPILLVLSDINWRPLDDFYRLHRQEDGELVFEGNLNSGQHFPGATSGGARATYLANRGVGWGLVSGDGWRVPYRGSDCVVYHEGCGHTVGLPHPEPGNGSVMSLGQYRGWISESWLDKDQKSQMKWQPEESEADSEIELFTHFRALPNPMVPTPGQQVTLKLDWPPSAKVQQAKVQAVRVRLQTAMDAAWIEVPTSWDGEYPESVSLGSFDHPTPVSYRLDATLVSGETVELWGYFQVRQQPNLHPLPVALSQDLFVPVGRQASQSTLAKLPSEEIDLLRSIDPESCWKTGQWTKSGQILESSKAYGVRIELPYALPNEYRLTAIVEPLDEPNGLIFGLRAAENRFAVLLNYQQRQTALSALENVAGRNVGNETTFTGKVMRKNQLSQVIMTVRNGRVLVDVDGRRIIDWQGDFRELSLGEYWSTPKSSRLLLGTYDCRYRFHRLSVEPIEEARN